MKNLTLIAILLASLFVLSCGKNEATITGHRSLYYNPVGQTLYVYPEDEIKNFTDAKREAANKVTAEMEVIGKKCERLVAVTESPNYSEDERSKAGRDRIQCTNDYLAAAEGLQKNTLADAPPTNLTTKIDSDGKFEIKVPSTGRYVLILKPDIIVWVNTSNKPKDVVLDGFDINAAVRQ